MSVRIARISAEPIELADHVVAVSDASAGAVSVFLGTVRDSDPDAAGEVVALEYSAHPDAESTLRSLAEQVIRAMSDRAAPEAAAPPSGAPSERSESKGDDLQIAVSHRVGRLGIGDAAVVIAVASGHRDEAFTACRMLIEAIKAQLPVWKRQVEADGSTAWKGLGG